MSLARLSAVLWRLEHEEDGPTATEYAVLLALIIVVLIAAITQIGAQVDGLYQDMVGCFPG